MLHFDVTKYPPECNICSLVFVLNQCYKIGRSGEKKEPRDSINDNRKGVYREVNVTSKALI